MSSTLLLQCRPGFESDCAAEICARATEADCYGFARTEPGQGYVIFECHDTQDAPRLIRTLDFSTLIFARQWFTGIHLEALGEDRVSPIVAALTRLNGAYSAAWLETPDTNAGKSLSRLARSLGPPLRAALQAGGAWKPNDGRLPRAHVLLTGGQSAWMGWAPSTNSAPWPMGIPRLRLPRTAPSRAVLKLEEGLHTFLTPTERKALVREGRTAVDLGAAPGGWTWLLVRNGMHVTAVDNGALLPELAGSPLVEHLRLDGFQYRPQRTVHWLVCDIVEQPRRIAELVARWYAQGWCERALFNLKLPMKRRHHEVTGCARRIGATVDASGRDYRLQIHQLYHDREEVTAYLAPREALAASGP